MRLLTENVPGNVHEAVIYINNQGRTPYLHQLVHIGSGGCIAIYMAYEFKAYQKLWDDLRYNPDNSCTEEEFNKQEYPA